MQKTVALFCILLAVVYGSSIREQRLKAMNQLTYSSLFTEIQTQITTGGPLTSITDTIEKFDKQIRNEQAEHDAMWAIQEADCSDEQVFRAGEIKTAHAAFKVASKAFKTCSNSLDRSTVDMGNVKKDEVDTTSARASLVTIREHEHTRYETGCAAMEHSLMVIEDAIEFLDELVAGEANLLQLTQHTMNFIRAGTKSGHMANIAPLVTLFAQMAASEQDEFVDSTAVERCKLLMTQIVEQVRANLEAVHEGETLAVDSFNGVKANLDATLRDLSSLSTRLGSHIDDMNACVLEEDIIKSAAQDKGNRNQDMLDTCNTMCDAFQHEYDTASEGRHEERDLLRLIRTMAEKRMVKYKDASSTNSVDGVEEFGGIDYEGDDYEATSDEWE